MIFYSSQEEEVDYSTNDIDETNDRNDVDNRTPDNAVEDDPQDEKFDPDDESSDGESNNIGDSNKSEKFTHRPFGNKQPPQLLKTTKVCTGKPKLTNKKKQPQGSKKPFPKKKKTDGDPNSKTLQTKFVNPSQSIPFIEKGGIKKRNTDAANTPLDYFFLSFLQMILLIKLWPKQTYIMIK